MALGRRQWVVVGVATFVVAIGTVAAVVASGGASDDGLGSATTTAAPVTTTTATPPPPSAPVVAVGRARLEALRLPEGTCDGWVPDDLSRTLTGGRSTGEPYDVIELLDWAVGDLDGEGASDAVARIGCGNGGSGYGMEAIGVLAAQREPVRIDMFSPVPTYWELRLFSVEIVEGTVRLDVGSTTEDDPHCCPSVDNVLAFVVEDGAFRLVDHVVQSAASMSALLVDAVNAGDEPAIAALATPEVGAALAALRAAGGNLRVDGASPCRRRFESDRIGCIVRAEDGSGLAVGWRTDDFLQRFADTLGEATPP